MKIVLPNDIKAKVLGAVINAALAGDTQMLRALLPHILPAPRRESPMKLELPPLDSPDNAVKASAAIFAAVADGVVTPSEAVSLGAPVATYLKAIEIVDLEKRLTAIEDKLKMGGRSVDQK